MAVRRILRAGHPLLRRRAEQVSSTRRRSLAFERLIDCLFSTMEDRQGVGLAAPQVQEPLRVFVYRIEPNERYPDIKRSIGPRVLINPRVVDHSEQTVVDWEGCLSLPDLRGRVPRYKWVEVEGVNSAGERVNQRVEGFEARVIQHELDHLDGTLYVDRMQQTESLCFLSEYRRFHADSSDSS